MEIVQYSAVFKDQVLSLILTIQQQEYGLNITAGDQPDLSSISDFYIRPGGNFWLALVDGKVVGSVALLKLNARCFALRKMFVMAEYRGSQYGVGGALLQLAERWALAQGAMSIYLGTTDQFKAAHRFYEKHGYNKIQKESLPVDFPVMSVDSVFYIRWLQ